MGWAGGMAFGGQMLSQLGMNLSNRIGTGRSLRQQMSREQVEQTRKEAAAGIVGRVEGAKAAGLHPLVAMGSNVGGATLPTGSSFNAVDPGFGAAAMQDREMRMRQEELNYQKSLDTSRAAAAAEGQRLANDAQRAEIKLREAQTAAQLKAMSDSDRDFAASQAQLARQQPTVGLRVPLKPIPNQYVPVKDRYGKTIFVPNPDLYDLDLPETVGAATLAVPELRGGQPGNWTDRAVQWWENLKRRSRQGEFKRPPPR